MLSVHVTPTVHVADLLGPALAALVCIALLSRIREPIRLKINAVLVAGFSTIYMGGGLGAWELLYVAPAAYVAYRALDSYRFVALGWLMHPVWDLVHHFYGQPIWPWVPTSSLGCAVFDPIVAIWALTAAHAATRVPLRPSHEGTSKRAPVPR